VSWDFAMAKTPGWHSTIFAPYFVVGAIFSGIAGVVIVMAILRKAFRLQSVLTPLHFDNLGKLLCTMTLLWATSTSPSSSPSGTTENPEEWEVFSSYAGAVPAALSSR